MASFLDVAILSKMSVIFVFLLIFAIVYAILEKTAFFGKNGKGVNAIIALAIAFLISIAKPAVAMINVMAPWFVVLFLFIFFIIFAVRMFGASEADSIAMIKDSRVYPYLIIIAVIIIIASFSSVFGQGLLEKGTGSDATVDEADNGDVVLPGDIEGGSTKTTSFGTNVLNTLVHPKVLGFIAIMLIGMFTVIFLTKSN